MTMDTQETKKSSESADKKKKGGQPSAAEETAAPYPDMTLCQKIHRLSTGAGTEDGVELAAKVFEEIAVELENPSLYKHVQKAIYDGIDPTLASAKLRDGDLASMQTKLDGKLKELEAAVEEARESAGDMEVMEARIAIARFAAKSLSMTEALEAYQKVVDWPKISSGKKMDALMECARIASFYGKNTMADDYIEKAQKIAGSGGDWDRRNRLKVYRALQHLLHRDTKAASSLLLDCIATFSCSEICSYTEFIVYVVLSNILHLPRPLLKSKILDGPEIRGVASEIPVVTTLVKSFYDCNYKAYLHAMVELEPLLQSDRFLAPHAGYWMRELHLLAYKQFLDAYQSVTLQAMAQSFGVSEDFIDQHCSRFIAADRLSAKIDKYGGVIVTNRPDLKNAQYREMIQKGDLLLNRIQKLSRVVDL